MIVLATVPVVSFAANSYDVKPCRHSPAASSQQRLIYALLDQIFEEKMPGGGIWSYVPMMLWVVIMYNLMWAATIDPGIIPRVQNPEVGMKKGCCYPVGLLLPSLPLGARG